MTGPQLRAIRLALGLTQRLFGAALGYEGDNVDEVIRKLERGIQPITPAIGRLAEMFRRHGVPKKYLAA